MFSRHMNIQSTNQCRRLVRSISTFGYTSMKLIGPGPVVASTPKKLPVGKSGLKLPMVFEPGVSPLEVSTLMLKRGLNAIVGMRYPVSDAKVHASIGEA